MMLRRLWTVLALGGAMSLMAGCAAPHMELAAVAPRHAVARTALKVAVLPLGDARDTEVEALGAWPAVPFLPYATSRDDRPDEPQHAADDPLHFRYQVARQLAQHLGGAGLFAAVQYIEGDWVDPADFDLVITGDLVRSTQRRSRTLFGLSVAGLPLWLLGLPAGTNQVEWAIDLQLHDPGTRRVFKALRVERTWKSWTGLYWGASGYPADEAESLRAVFIDVAARVDEAFDDVPALAALSVRPTLPDLPPARSPERQVVPLGRAFVLGSDTVAPELVELFIEEVSRQSQGTVIGIDDVNLLLDWQKRTDLLGCDEAKCLVEIGAALGADFLFALEVGALADDQVLTVKLIAPADGSVLGRRTWQATGVGPAVFAARMPDIVAAALVPLGELPPTAE